MGPGPSPSDLHDAKPQVRGVWPKRAGVPRGHTPAGLT